MSLALHPASCFFAQEYAAIGRDVKRLKEEVEEKEKEIDELKRVLNKAHETNDASLCRRNDCMT